MNFLQLQNEVLSDRFAEAKRDSAKNWLNYRYGRLWGMEPWTFKAQTDTLAVSSGLSQIAKGSRQVIRTISDITQTPFSYVLDAIRPEDFYQVKDTTPGQPYYYTVIGSNIIFSCPLLINRNFTVVSDIPFTILSADTDVPAIPTEYHLLLASGAASHGLRLENDPSWQPFEDEWQRGIEDLKKNYLSEVRIYSDHTPGWP